MKKTCSKCKIEKDVSEFNKDKTRKDGLHSLCRSCQSELRKAYYDRHKEQENLHTKKYKQENRDRITEYNYNYYHDNIDSELKRAKEYRENNREKTRIASKNYRLNNKDIVNKKRNIHKRKKIQTDSFYKLKYVTRENIRRSIKRLGYTKNSNTYRILGCEWKFFKEYIEAQFKKGMTWDNQGGWHLDHIVPISSAKTEEDVIRLNHYTNFQPLWAEDNIAKSNKIIEGIQFKIL